MTQLNYRVDFLKQSPQQVARDFLLAKGLYKPPQSEGKGIIRLGSKIFGEQYILINMYEMLIKGYTNLAVESKTGLGGTKICFDALAHNEIDMYPEYTGTGLLVILKPSQQKITELIANRDSVYQFVKRKFEEKYHLTWLLPLGFNNTYALMMRKQQAWKLNLKSISDLKRYANKE
jgi:osmoprotectant transport system permease protein